MGVTLRGGGVDQCPWFFCTFFESFPLLGLPALQRVFAFFTLNSQIFTLMRQIFHFHCQLRKMHLDIWKCDLSSPNSFNIILVSVICHIDYLFTLFTLSTIRYNDTFWVVCRFTWILHYFSSWKVSLQEQWWKEATHHVFLSQACFYFAYLGRGYSHWRSLMTVSKWQSVSMGNCNDYSPT